MFFIGVSFCLFHSILVVFGSHHGIIQDIKYQKEMKDISGATITRIETRDKFVCYSKCSVNPVCQGVMYNQHTRLCEMAQSVRICNPGLQEIWIKQIGKALKYFDCETSG